MVGHIAWLEAVRGQGKVEDSRATAFDRVHTHGRGQDGLDDVHLAPLVLDGLVSGAPEVETG